MWICDLLDLKQVGRSKLTHGLKLEGVEMKKAHTTEVMRAFR